ncbi:MAG: hypothetical protein RR957_08260, partial [Oscillospiraceae bacterium]
IAPTYFVSGNNETWSKHESEFLKILTDKGVFVLNNKLAKIEKGDSYINLLGYKDILYADDVMRFNVLEKELSKLEKTIPADDKSLNILMFHRVNYFDTVSKYNFDLVLSGHAHGGQINLPIIKDKILDKNLGQHKYSNGYYENGDKKMIATAGLEKNLKKPRIFNTPEIVMVKLEMEK